MEEARWTTGRVSHSQPPNLTALRTTQTAPLTVLGHLWGILKVNGQFTHLSTNQAQPRLASEITWDQHILGGDWRLTWPFWETAGTKGVFGTVASANGHSFTLWR